MFVCLSDLMSFAFCECCYSYSIMYVYVLSNNTSFVLGHIVLIFVIIALLLVTLKRDQIIDQGEYYYDAGN